MIETPEVDSAPKLLPAAHIALCLAFAGRFSQLYSSAISEKVKALYLAAAAHAIDRTRPPQELALYADRRNTNDPVEFLIQLRDKLTAVPSKDWPKKQARLRNSSVEHLLTLLDRLLQGAALPAGQLAYIRSWLQPFTETKPELLADIESAVGGA